jgi:hypothetical protein
MASAGMREPAQRASRSSPGRRPLRWLSWPSLWWCTASFAAPSVLARPRKWACFLLWFSHEAAPRKYWRNAWPGAPSNPAKVRRAASVGCRFHRRFARPFPCSEDARLSRPQPCRRFPQGFSGEEQSSTAPDQARKTPFLKPFSAAHVTPGMRRDDVNCPGGNGGSRRIALAPRSGEAGELKLCDSLPMGAVQGSNAVASRPNVPGKAVRIGRPRGGMAIRPSFQTTRSAAPKAAIPARFITEISERYRNIRNRILFT